MQILTWNLWNTKNSLAVFDQISSGDSVTIDSDSETLIFNDNDGLISNFDSICQGAGGMTLLTNVEIEGCDGFPYDYKGYPNCISETCGGTITSLDVETKTAVLIGAISAGLGLNFDDICKTEIFFTHFLDSPTFSCGYAEDGYTNNDLETDLLDAKLLQLGTDETCEKDMMTGR